MVWTDRSQVCQDGADLPRKTYACVHYIVDWRSTDYSRFTVHAPDSRDNSSTSEVVIVRAKLGVLAEVCPLAILLLASMILLIMSCRRASSAVADDWGSAAVMPA